MPKAFPIYRLWQTKEIATVPGISVNQIRMCRGGESLRPERKHGLDFYEQRAAANVGVQEHHAAGIGGIRGGK
jgi:hypothetical protein